MIGKQFVVVGVQRASRGKHDGGIKVTDDATNCACCVNTSLCAT